MAGLTFFCPMTGRPESQASEARHGSGVRPIERFPAHPPDQITQAAINLRSPCPISGFPTSEDFEASAMPTQNGLRLHHLGRTNKARPDPGHRYEQGAISAAQSKKGGRARFLRENRNLQLGYAPNSPASECLRVTCRGTTAFTFTATFVSRSTTRSTGASNSYLNPVSY